MNNDYVNVVKLIQKNANLNARDNNGDTALMWSNYDSSS
jgi:ankyrin repeat protein